MLIGKRKLFSPTLASMKVMFGLKNSLEKDEIYVLSLIGSGWGTISLR